MQVAQQSLPLAVVRGQAYSDIPADLYIPPEALEVFLEAFEGPLDLLLYLIRKQKLDVVDLSIHQITSQYLEYIEMLTDARIELAADYLVMAATLAEIKSRLLLPKPELEGDSEEDPRALLIRQLKAYETIKDASADIDNLPRLERDFHVGQVSVAGEAKTEIVPPDVSLAELAQAFTAVLQRVEAYEHHHVQKEVLSTRERMVQILEKLNADSYIPFQELFAVEEGKAGVVVSFLALMELVKEMLVELVQAEPLSIIYVKAN
ncbi:segregation/condensation protein A [Shewanella sp. OPT22]|nr:segregation/condensation protein A [Shewanella sp. OPT22]